MNEKSKNIELEKKLETIETEVRKEVTEDFNRLMVSVEEKWEARLQQEKESEKEHSEWRLNKVQEVYSARKRKRAKTDLDDEDPPQTSHADEAKVSNSESISKTYFFGQFSAVFTNWELADS